MIDDSKTESPFGWHAILDPGEKILWQGRPANGIRVSRRSLARSVFGAIFAGVPLSNLIRGVSEKGALDGTNLFFFPFVLIGAYLFVGQYFWEAFRRSRTWYSLTNKRAIIATRTWKHSMSSWPISRDTNLEYIPGAESQIYFAKVQRQDREDGGLLQSVGFEYVSDGDDIYRLIRKIQSEAT